MSLFESDEVMKARAWGASGDKPRVLKKLARRVGDAPVAQRRDEAMLVRDEMLAMLNGASAAFETKKNCFRDLRRVIKAEHPDVAKDDWPRCPGEIFLMTQAQEKKNLIARTNNKIVINASLLIQRMVHGVRDGMERKQVPQVLFCLGYLVGLRPNDMNTQKKRTNETFSCAEDYQCIENATTGADEWREVVGTIKNRKPSKENASVDFVGEYTTVFICETEDYDLIKSAIAWVMDDCNAKRPCTTLLVEYERGDPSGAEAKGQEWRSGREKGWITTKMVERLGLNGAVASSKDWGIHTGGFTKQLGRSFVASCIEQGRLEFDKGLTSSQAIELALGHAPLSNNNVNYLKFDCRPCPTVAGVVAVKVCEDYPADGVTYGICLVKKQE